MVPVAPASRSAIRVIDSSPSKGPTMLSPPVAISARNSETRYLKLGAAANNLGLSTEGSIPLEFTVITTINMKFGIDRARLDDPESPFFVEMGGVRMAGSVRSLAEVEAPGADLVEGDLEVEEGPDAVGQHGKGGQRKGVEDGEVLRRHVGGGAGLGVHFRAP